MTKSIIKLLSILTLIIFSASGAFALTTELVKTNPSPVLAGDYADITLRFTNDAIGSSNTLNDISFNIEKTNYIMPVTSDSNKIKKIQSGEYVTRTFRVFFSSELKQGNIDIPVIIKYNSIQTKTNIQIYVQEGKTAPKLYLGQIQSTPNEILQDSKNNKLNVIIQNLGEIDADLVTAKLIVNKSKIIPSYSYSFEDSVAKIQSGTQSNFKFTIDVKKNIESDVPAKLELRYRAKNAIGNTYKIYSKNISFMIQITPAPYIVIQNIEQLSDMALGTTENKLKITLKNLGSQDADEVRIRVVPDISYPFIFEETTQYVSAKIKPNQTADVIFKVEVSDSGDIRKYISTAVIETLVENSRYSREDIFSITTSKSKKVSYNKIAYIIVIAIIIISLTIGFQTYLSNKRKTKK